MPQFGYQLQLAGSEVEAKVQGRERLGQFLKGMYGGRGSNGRVLFDPQKGIDFDVLETIGQTPLLNSEVINQ